MSQEGFCHYCKGVADAVDDRTHLRPYGPHGEDVCYTCATSPAHVEHTDRMIYNRIMTEGVVAFMQAEGLTEADIIEAMIVNAFIKPVETV